MAPYGYKDNKTFIDDTYKLLKKLNKKKLVKDDTLFLCLDKSVRPLSYAIRKEMKELGTEIPEFNFVNYSSRDNKDKKVLDKEISKRLNKKYKNIVILDRYVDSAKSMIEADKSIRKNLEKRGLDSNIYRATLEADSASFSRLVEYTNPSMSISAMEEEMRELFKEGTSKQKSPKERKQVLGNLEDNSGLIYAKKSDYSSSPGTSNTGIVDKEGYSRKTSDKETYRKFIENRKKLNRDIKNYISSEIPEKEKDSIKKIFEAPNKKGP